MVLTESDLKAGDVVLSLGDSLESRLIRAVDGGDYSHAAFYDGRQLVEAVTAGVVQATVQSTIDDQVSADVYRFRSDKDARLGDPAWPAEPLIEHSHEYLGEKFANFQLVLLFLLVSGRKTPVPAILKRHLRTRLEQAVGMLNALVDNGREPVTCSELVYRCFYNAPPAKKYALSIAGVLGAKRKKSMAVGSGRGSTRARTVPVVDEDRLAFERLAKVLAEEEEASGTSTPHPVQAGKKARKTRTGGLDQADADSTRAFDDLQRQLMRAYTRGRSAGPRTLKKGARKKAANPNVVGDFVSPRDLAQSANLRKIGKLE